MDEFDLMIKDIMISRKPENYLEDLLIGITEFKNEMYPNSIFYKTDKFLLFQVDTRNKFFWYDYDKIHLVLENKYHCSEDKRFEVLITTILKKLNLKIKLNDFVIATTELSNNNNITINLDLWKI